MTTTTLAINGQSMTVDVPPQTLLVDLLRSSLGLTGTHVGCDTSQCGACTVMVDGRAVRSCSTLVPQVAGCQVTTVEGLAKGDQLHPLQQAFRECHGLQCGFCTPGMLMTAASLLGQEPLPSEERIAHELEGNLCRCTGYVNIVAAVGKAARVMAGATPAKENQS